MDSIASSKDGRQDRSPASISGRDVWSEAEDSGPKCVPDGMLGDLANGNAELPFSCIEGSYCGRTKIEEDSITLETVVCKAVRCKCQFCDDCKESQCYQTRDKYREAVKKWPRASMLTLTIDPSKFASGQEAYEFIMAKRGVSELIRAMKKAGLLEHEEWFSSIEFHPKRPDWVHWHVGVCPTKKWHAKLNSRYHNGGEKWLDSHWKYGHAHEKTSLIASPEHAMNYISKYIAKQDQAVAIWALDYERNFRKFSTSRGFGSNPKKVRKADGQPKKWNRKRRTIRERLGFCKTTSNILVHRVRFESVENETVKSESWQFCESLDVPAEKVERDPWFLAVVRKFRDCGVVDTRGDEPGYIEAETESFAVVSNRLAAEREGIGNYGASQSFEKGGYDDF